MSVLVVVGACQGASGRGRWVPVLSDVSFEVERAEVVGVVGGRLSGKTTLLEIAAGIRTPERGSVRFSERELTSMSSRERVRLRGRELAWLNRAGMSQRLKVSKIVGWLLASDRGRRETERRAAEMLERVGAQDCAGKRWGDLSPWEQVLVGFAQAFAGSPELVVIDDLLDGLGARATEEASDLLRALIAESEHRPGVLMSASDRDSAVFANRAWSLDRGGKLTPTSGHRDTHAEILRFPGRNEDEGSRRVGVR